MPNQPRDVFFYGLFMDAAILAAADVTASDPRRAFVDGYALRLGRRATLVPCESGRAYGVLFSVSGADLTKLYSGPDLRGYSPQIVCATAYGGNVVEAVCYNLQREPGPDERNEAYAAQLRSVLLNLQFPADYIADIE